MLRVDGEVSGANQQDLMSLYTHQWCGVVVEQNIDIICQEFDPWKF